jgi:hypothetical protein
MKHRYKYVEPMQGSAYHYWERVTPLRWWEFEFATEWLWWPFTPRYLPVRAADRESENG